MKKIKLSLAALTLVLAIAGTTTANATKSQNDVGFCSSVDPNGTECLNEFPIECCQDDNTLEIYNIRTPRPH
jgi:hypothetical protein